MKTKAHLWFSTSGKDFVVSIPLRGIGHENVDVDVIAGSSAGVSIPLRGIGHENIS
jgi:hypothetical protein